MNLTPRKVPPQLPRITDDISPSRSVNEDSRFYACSHMDTRLASDYSRIANYTAQRPEFNRRKDGEKRRALIYMVAAFGASFLRFSRRSTMHGLNHLAQARTAQRRLFWLCISLAALVGFFFNMFFLIEKYIQVPVLTNVLHDSDNFIFPDVTFCNVNPIYFPPRDTPEFDRMTATIAEFEEFKKSDNPFARRLALADYLFIQRNTYYVHPKWLTIVECSYMQTRCTSEHFDEKIIWPYGACYTFNATRMPHNMTREISTRTRYNRFRPDLRIIVYKALDFPEAYQFDPHDSFQVPPGILLMTHEPGTYPHIGHSGIVDDCTQIELKMTSVTHLAKLGKCVPERPHVSYVNAATNESQQFISSQSDCLDAEVQKALANFCGCQMHTMPVMYKYHHLPFCFSGALSLAFLEECFNKATESVDRSHCFLDVCKHFTIDRVIAHTRFPAIQDRHTNRDWLRLLAVLEEREKAQYSGKSDLARLALKANFTATPNLTIGDVSTAGNISLLDENFVNRNFMMLRVVPASLFMDRVEETEEYPFSRLLSDIGGCVGLWIGASLITLFEFADLILDFMDLGNMGYPQVDPWQVQPQANSQNAEKSIPHNLDDCERGAPSGPDIPLTKSFTTISDLSTGQQAQQQQHQNAQQKHNGANFFHYPMGNDTSTRPPSPQPPKMIPLFYLPSHAAKESTV